METGPGESPAGGRAGTPGPLYKRLPRGPHRLAPSDVARHQRLRIHGAMVRAVAAEGYDAVTVRLLIALAGVSRRSFYEQFACKQECFLATFDEIAREHVTTARRACALTPGEPSRRLEAALGAYAGAVAQEPEAAALLQLHPLTVGAAGVLRLRAVAAAWERHLRLTLAGSPLLPAPKGASTMALLGGIYGIVGAHLSAPERPSRGRLERDLARWALAPKLPPREAEARRVVSLLRKRVRRAPLMPTAVAPALRTPPRTDRERLLAGALRAAARERAARLSPAQIADEAGIPLGAFFELFEDRDDCLRAAIRDAGERLLAIAGGAADSGPGQPAALRDTLAAMLSHLAAHPLHARALTVLPPCGGPSCRSYGARLEAQLGQLLAAGLDGAAAGPAVVGALWHLVRCHLADRSIRRLPEAAGPLTLFALAPEHGAGRAAAVLLEGR
jgi:AcrR family transcriptional regulator